MKEQMEAYIRNLYPEAVLDSYSKSAWGEEYLFYPAADAENWYCCIVQGGKLAILTDF